MALELIRGPMRSSHVQFIIFIFFNSFGAIVANKVIKGFQLILFIVQYL